MSASRLPTFKPRSRRPKARLTAVVDLPTPPLPEATAMMAATPGMPAGDGAGWLPGAGPRCDPCCGPGRGGAPGGGRRDAVEPAPAARSAVSATITDFTPG